MKNFTKRILVLLVIMVMAGGAVFAVNDNVVITGTVATTATLNVADLTKAYTIDPTAGLSKTGLTTITVITNVFAGYDVYATSTSDGLLGGAGGTQTTIPYSIYIDSGLGILASATDFDGATSLMFLGTPTDVDGVDYVFSISVAGPSSGDSLPAGIFEDTLTFVLTTR